MTEHIKRFQVIDTETVGLKPFEHGGGVCEISIREVCPDSLDTLNEMYSLLHPEGPISPIASGVHMITDDKVADCLDIQTWLITEANDPWGPDKEPFWFIAYNAPFDHRFLKPYIETECMVADILILTRRYYPDAPDHKMQTLRYYLKLDDPSDGFDAHSASGDTKLLVKVIQKLMEDTGFTLEELCNDSLKRDPLTKMPFGKYKGRSFDSIQKENPKYFEWCLKNFENIDPELEKAMKTAQGK